jgi:hypothetical protein
MRAGRIASFAEFWPFYLGQHSKPLTRALHFVGTDVAVASLAVAAWRRDPWFLLVALVGAYGLAWVGHFFVERNRPATFSYPLWSLAADFRMWALMWTGGLGRELRKGTGVRPG